MTFLAKLKGALGLKPDKPERIEPDPPRKPIPKVSAKKRAHKAAERAAGAWEHMAAVKELPCLVCGRYGVEVHHLPYPKSDWRVIPLCAYHHRREYGEQSYHYSRRNFNARHGSDEQLLAQTVQMLDK